MIGAKDFASPPGRSTTQDSQSVKSRSQRGRIHTFQSQRERMCTGISFGLVNQIDKQKNGGHSAGFHICLSTRRLRWLLNFTTWVVISEPLRWCTMATHRNGRYKELNCDLKIVLLIWSKLEPASYLHATVFSFRFFKSALLKMCSYPPFFLSVSIGIYIFTFFSPLRLFHSVSASIWTSNL